MDPLEQVINRLTTLQNNYNNFVSNILDEKIDHKIKQNCFSKNKVLFSNVDKVQYAFQQISQKQADKNSDLLMLQHRLNEQLAYYDKKIHDLGNKLQICQNKLYSVLDHVDRVDNSKEFQHKSSNQKIATDIIQSAINISKRCPFFNEYKFQDNIIEYRGVDRKATQLLSQNVIKNDQQCIYGLKVIRAVNGCIKFGVIDAKYIGQRSCWNYPNSVYYHGWGHTMTGGLQQQFQYGGFQSGYQLKMKILLCKGLISWQVKNNYDGKPWKVGDYNLQHKAKILKNNKIQWVPFIAMYNKGDKVEWIKIL